MPQNSFVTKIDLSLAGRLRQDLESQGFTLSQPAHTLFAGKKKGVSCTLYESGKLLVQGKEMQEFIEFYLEPQLLQSFEYTTQQVGAAPDLDLTRRIGIDESGKGDYFGPLCVAGVCAGGEEIQALAKLGVCDSKTLTDRAALTLAPKIRDIAPWYVVRINPLKYNELYQRFGNLNSLLAWGHATTIEQLVEKTQCSKVIVDQFANERVVENALKRKQVEVDLTQRTKAEQDVVVAAASILARAAFLQGLESLGKQTGFTLPKGGASSKIVEAGRQYVARYGREQLNQIAKLHFKTTERL